MLLKLNDTVQIMNGVNGSTAEEVCCYIRGIPTEVSTFRHGRSTLANFPGHTETKKGETRKGDRLLY